MFMNTEVWIKNTLFFSGQSIRLISSRIFTNATIIASLLGAEKAFKIVVYCSNLVLSCKRVESHQHVIDIFLKMQVMNLTLHWCYSGTYFYRAGLETDHGKWKVLFVSCTNTGGFKLSQLLQETRYNIQHYTAPLIHMHWDTLCTITWLSAVNNFPCEKQM